VSAVKYLVQRFVVMFPTGRERILAAKVGLTGTDLRIKLIV